MRSRIVEFLLWTAVCIVIGGTLTLFIYFKTVENAQNESEKPEKGWKYLGEPDSTGVVGFGLF